MNWTPCKATKVAKKLPENWEKACERTFYRIIYLIIQYKILVSLLINMDQTGVILIPGAGLTYHEKKAKQVHVLGKDEKRAYILTVASSYKGDLLPFQAIWARKTMASCPKANARQTAESFGFHFTSANSFKNSTSHFSTLQTMKN